MSRRNACLAAVALATVALTLPVRAFDLADLAAARARVPESTARFHETRHIAALAAPVQRSGTLLYRRPDYLEMNVETPRAEQMVISNRMLRITTASGVRTLALDSEPALLAWTESLRATLAGDVTALRQNFATTLTGDEGSWKLVLEPRDATLRAQIAAIEISGAKDAIRRIEMREQGGDDAVMEILPERSRTP